VIGTLLWLFDDLGFFVYAESFGTYDKTYGAIAG